MPPDDDFAAREQRQRALEGNVYTSAANAMEQTRLLRVIERHLRIIMILVGFIAIMSLFAFRYTG